MSYTPSPWRVESSKDEYGNGSWVMVGANGEDVFSCDWVAYEGGGSPPTEADARLIAAAPDLLEATQALVAAYGFPGNPDFPDAELDKWLAVLDAIAKAEGQRSVAPALADQE